MMIALGKNITLSMPNGEKRRGQFAIVELTDVLASHNELTFAPSKGYPVNDRGQNINDRNYEDDVAAQERVRDNARNLDPYRLITTSRTPSGTPIVAGEQIDGKWIVVSGNNRTMSTKIAERMYGDNYRDYLEALCGELESFGFSRTDKKERIDCHKGQLIYLPTGDDYSINNDAYYFKLPFLIRIDYDFPAFQTQELAKYNQSTMKGKRAVDKTIERSNSLRENPLCKTRIPAMIDEYERMSDFYADRNAQKRMLEALLQCNIITEQSIPEYFDDGYFTNAGKELVESVLAGVVLEKEALKAAERDGIKQARRVIVYAMPVLVANSALPGSGNLIPHINNAILYLNEMKSSGLPFDQYINQGALFSEKEWHPWAIYLSRLMSQGQRKFKWAIKAFNESVKRNTGAALFSDQNVTPEEAFQAYVIDHIPADEAKLIQAHSKDSAGSIQSLIEGLSIKTKEITPDEGYNSAVAPVNNIELFFASGKSSISRIDWNKDEIRIIVPSGRLIEDYSRFSGYIRFYPISDADEGIKEFEERYSRDIGLYYFQKSKDKRQEKTFSRAVRKLNKDSTGKGLSNDEKDALAENWASIQDIPIEYNFWDSIRRRAITYGTYKPTSQHSRYPSWLFVGFMGASTVYADRRRQKGGDYLQIAHLNESTGKVNRLIKPGDRDYREDYELVYRLAEEDAAGKKPKKPLSEQTKKLLKKADDLLKSEQPSKPAKIKYKSGDMVIDKDGKVGVIMGRPITERYDQNIVAPAYIVRFGDIKSYRYEADLKPADLGDPAKYNLEPDLRQGDYFVSVYDQGKPPILALGPFPTHQEAIDKVEIVRSYVNEKDPAGHFYSYGTARQEKGSGNLGKLNDRLGYKPKSGTKPKLLLAKAKKKKKLKLLQLT